MQNSTVITLVHGTWAQNAPWIQESSPLRTALQRALGKDTVFRPFLWSGENSFAGRLAAAEDLRKFLQEGIEQSPGGRQVIIAHSHGGNVTMKALENCEYAQNIDAVVCLATPFIMTRLRQFGEHSMLVIVLAKWLTCVLLGIAVSMMMTNVLGADKVGYWGVIALALMLLGGLGSWWTISRVGRAWLQHAKEWAAQVNVSSPAPPTRMFVIRAAADEATEGLSWIHFHSIPVLIGWRLLSWIAIAPLSIALKIDNWAYSRLYGRLLVGGGVWSTVACYINYGYPDAPPEKRTFLLLYIAVLLTIGSVCSKELGLLRLVAFLATPVFVILGLVFVMLLLCLSLVVVPFNTSIRGLWTFVKTAIWLGPIDISAETVPPGRTIQTRQMTADTKEGLRHSRPYLDPESIQWIVEWLQYHDKD
ncbi:hypothetical protein FCL47_18710 [Desulfopila sp. IMCC35006]|uniref:esterase/lipase family protein n=1 Tax=Desulfopila sp. IMCC35006 TaxID=2569542 RepID=UPI0010AC8BE0|nr:alpha/beta fold hydrolase [Desulfopila sp. IMCC35006]TKB24220.1 hypothetical protein FCL47_18710 [Desulfopila sp. IMCC35006]